MLLVALVISSMTVSTRHQARIAGHRERRIASLYAMSRELAATRGEENILRIAVRHVAEVFEAQAVVLLPNETGRIVYPKGEGDAAILPWQRPERGAMGVRPRADGRTGNGHLAGRARWSTCR